MKRNVVLNGHYHSYRGLSTKHQVVYIMTNVISYNSAFFIPTITILDFCTCNAAPEFPGRFDAAGAFSLGLGWTYDWEKRECGAAHWCAGNWYSYIKV